MVKIQEAEQQIITHHAVYDERPIDSELLPRSKLTSGNWRVHRV